MDGRALQRCGLLWSQTVVVVGVGRTKKKELLNARASFF
jgi:hypothetical protein